MDRDHVWPVVVIGAGQAGLSAAHGLLRKGLKPGVDFLVLDSERGPGGAWRHRWDSLTLGKTHSIYDLPGLALEQYPQEMPAREIVKEYYGEYEQKFALGVVRPVKVTQVTSTSMPAPPLDVDGLSVPITLLQLTCQQGDEAPDEAPKTIYARTIISATGTWSRPFIPYVSGIETFGGRSIHTVDYDSADAFADKKVVVVGGGLSAVQFILELRGIAETIWATRRPPNFSPVTFDAIWGAEVEDAVDQRTFAGKRSASVVRTTGIPMIPPYMEGVREGLLISRGMFDRVRPGAVRFRGYGEGYEDSSDLSADGLGPSARPDLAVPESWQPLAEPTWVEADVIFWNTGFRSETRHLRPLKLRSSAGGMVIENRVEVASDQRVFVAGYGSGASTFGATRTGRAAATAAVKRLNLQ